MNPSWKSVRWVGVWALSGALGVGNVAFASEFRHDTATFWWTATSGSGDVQYLEHIPGAGSGIYRILVAETADRPQAVHFWNNVLRFGGGAENGGEVLEIFNGAYGFKEASLPVDHFITAVQVCENNRRIKGVRIWGRRVDSSGLPMGAAALREFKRTNCGSKDWAEKVSCREGEFALGARANYYGNLPGSKMTFSGLALRCGRLQSV